MRGTCGPCLCGDPYCPSCGTAQGTYPDDSEPETFDIAPRPAVFVCSPYRGATPGRAARNVEYARAAMLDSLERGEAPFAPHVLYTQVLDDSIPAQRDAGINAGFVYLARSQVVAVYTDLGVSEGMQAEMTHAGRLGIRIEKRSLPGWA